jgi:dTDP-4-amino-4,6-dideoxygalactose transaminase
MYLSPPHVGAEEREMLLAAFDSNWIAPLGPEVDAFERELASKVGVADAAALSSGTAALHLALVLLGVGADDEVITSTFTFAATANAIRYVGATPVFIDADPDTWEISPGLLAEELDRRAKTGRLPKAVVTVDLYGQCADYGQIVPLCERHGIPVIQDAAEALGAKYGDAMAGSQGKIGVFSFNGNKIITTSGGGMLVSDDASLCERARFLASQARDPAPHYQHSQIGYNYRLSNLLAAVGRAQLRKLDERVARRRAINARYHERLGELAGIGFMPAADYGTANCWLTCITVDAEAFGATPDTIREALGARDIECRPVWKPMHLQPVFDGAPVVGGKVSEDLFARGLCLPSGSVMSDADVDRVAELIRGVPRNEGGSA